ncbi:MFS transporter [Sphaerulina musiva SO2202]|uniref:MFS transporter n=1 Tax=Sphaerulina musiva (strain SO2202) TaxID=692275 RepID=N1QDG0_SPHMS|nr:MFS transporter [Sphaerulina musiva SO2202]EMF09411.1 MFS transporter [Sphaerulina musiva SO2202]
MRQHGQSSTIVVESAELELPPVQLEDYRSSSKKPSISGRSLRSAAETWDEDRNETLPAPTTAAPEESESWNSSTGTIWKVSAAFWSFAVMGLNDATYGAIIPYLQPFYSLRYAIVSLIFLSPFIGYTLSAVLNNAIHLKFGQRGVAFVGPLCHLLAYIINAVHPPYPVLVISFILAGFGNGLLDAGWNAWIGAMLNANEILGFLHAFYGLGATIAPLIATAMITRADLPWYYWYYCMIGFAVAELAISLYAFWEDTGAKFRERNARTSDETGSRLREATMKMPAARITWLCAMFLLGYVGVEVALGGWIVEFMIKVRDAEKFAAGMSATGFWLGMTVGRVILGFVTPRIGEKLSIMLYLPIAIGLQLLFWLVPQFYVSTVAVALQGFFLGPCFPAAVVACTKLLPKHLHVSSIGFAAAFGGSGGAIFPYAVGAIAQAKGVQVLQPIILALMAVIWGLWVMLPRMNKKQD